MHSEIMRGRERKKTGHAYWKPCPLGLLERLRQQDRCHTGQLERSEKKWLIPRDRRRPRQLEWSEEEVLRLQD
jgi:hypothetical protein